MTSFFTGFTLLRPWWLLALLPILASWAVMRREQDPSQLYKGLIDPYLLKHLLIQTKHGPRIRPHQAILVLWALAVIALSGPSWRMEPSPFAEEKAGLMILLRVSPSMKTEDLRPSRLERACQKLHDLLALRIGTNAGLIAYRGSAHMVMPLTRDARIIEQAAQALDVSVMPVEGDALGEALALADKQFVKGDAYGSVLVITDGIDTSQLQALDHYRKTSETPIQILAAAAFEKAAVQSGILQGARALKAPVQLITIDDSDVRRVNARAKSSVIPVAVKNRAARRQDEGYALVPFIALGVLFWVRKGWHIRWD